MVRSPDVEFPDRTRPRENGGNLTYPLIALQRIDALRDSSRVSHVVADSWWSYWPMRYVLADRKDIRLTIVNQPWDYRFPADYRIAMDEIGGAEEIFAVSFVGQDFDRWLTQNAGAAVAEVHGYARDPILRIYRLDGN